MWNSLYPDKSICICFAIARKIFTFLKKYLYFQETGQHFHTQQFPTEIQDSAGELKKQRTSANEQKGSKYEDF